MMEVVEALAQTALPSKVPASQVSLATGVDNWWKENCQVKKFEAVALDSRGTELSGRKLSETWGTF